MRHVPEGAVPKDGPSAGVTLATSILSALIKKKVKSNIAMTGEITLRGKVLPIGGLKEKLLAAYREDITTIIIPKENEKNLQEIPSNLKKKFKIIPVAEVQEVFDKAIILKAKKKVSGKRKTTGKTTKKKIKK